MSHVNVRHEGAAALLEMDFRGRLNLMDPEAIHALRDAVRSLSGRRGLRVTVLTSAPGKPFVGGADLHAMRDLGPGAARAFITGLTESFTAVRALEVPVVAAIRGYAVGGGLELALACDLRVASGDAQFGLPEVRVGIPSVIEAALLPRMVGLGRAQYLLYTGDLIGAETALQWGLIDRLVPPDGLEEAAREVAGAVAACGPTAIRAQKRLLRGWQDSHLEAGIAAGIGEFDRTFETGDPREGMTAFLERREARYKD
jgi:enoyl-CoA hydratase/carnithine racemase